LVFQDYILKLTDFAEAPYEQSKTDFQYCYQAPESINRKRCFNIGKIVQEKPCDIWSLGAIIYYLLAKKTIFEANPYSNYVQKLKRK